MLKLTSGGGGKGGSVHPLRIACESEAEMSVKHDTGQDDERTERLLVDLEHGQSSESWDSMDRGRGESAYSLTSFPKSASRAGQGVLSGSK